MQNKTVKGKLADEAWSQDVNEQNLVTHLIPGPSNITLQHKILRSLMGKKKQKKTNKKKQQSWMSWIFNLKSRWALEIFRVMLVSLHFSPARSSSNRTGFKIPCTHTTPGNFIGAWRLESKKKNSWDIFNDYQMENGTYIYVCMYFSHIYTYIYIMLYINIMYYIELYYTLLYYSNIKVISYKWKKLLYNHAATECKNPPVRLDSTGKSCCTHLAGWRNWHSTSQIRVNWQTCPNNFW